MALSAIYPSWSVDGKGSRTIFRPLRISTLVGYEPGTSVLIEELEDGAADDPHRATTTLANSSPPRLSRPSAAVVVAAAG
jgi:hypothetical protein